MFKILGTSSSKIIINIYFKQIKKRIKFGYKIDCSMRLKLSLKKVNIITYFENLIVGLYVLYVFNRQVKFCVNQMLCTI